MNNSTNMRILTHHRSCFLLAFIKMLSTI